GILGEAFGRDLVPMLAAALANALEAVADLDALDGIDAHHRARDLGIELVEAGLAEARRHTRRNDIDAGADRVAVAAQLDHEGFELFDSCGIGTEERVVVDTVEIHRLELDRAERGEIAANPDARALQQEFPRNGP